jgi:hypothetical protein
MDYFINKSGEAYENAGLLDLMLRYQCNPVVDWSVNADFHYFKTAADYTSDFDGEETTDVGMEFDFSISTARVRGVTLVGGFSVFLPTESFAGTDDPDPGFWLYDMIILNF